MQLAKESLTLTLISSLLLAAGAAAAAQKRPNIIFILADDLGYMDVTAYAAKTRGVSRAACFYETPHIDRLVDRGIAFSQAYVNQLCSPSRAAILTGRYHCRIGMTTAWFDNIPNFYNQGTKAPPGYHPLDSDHKDNIKVQQAWLNAKVIHGIPSGQHMDRGWDEICLPEVLTDHDSAFIGKWHCGGGGVVGYGPDNQGFETLAHLDSGACPYFQWRPLWAPGTWEKWPSHRAVWNQPRAHGSYPPGEPRSEYLTDALTDVAVAYIDERSSRPNEPFLLYFSHFSVHTPIQARKQDIDYFSRKANRGWNGHDDPTYAAMVRALDDSVGRIVAKLDQTGLLDNTIIIFTSDNGGLMSKTSNAPLRNGKAFLYEGGVRVPLVVWAPGRVEGPKWCDVPVHATDLLPTIAELAGYRVKHRVDGQSLVSLLHDPDIPSGRYVPKPIYWHYPFNVGLADPDTGLPLPPHSAMRKGDHKLIWDWHGKLQLYNIANDIGEQHDLSQEQPELTRQLFADLVDWLDANVERRYFPTPNPDYDERRDPRKYPFRDLRKELLGLTSSPGLSDAMGRNAGRP